MKHIKATLFALFLMFVSVNVHAGLIEDAKRGEELMFQRNYAEAVAVFQKIEADYPDSPTGSFGQMAAWQIQMFENLDFRFRSEFEAAEKKFERQASQLLKDYPSDWDMFISGAGYGMRGFFYARDGKWFRALGSAVRAVQILKRLNWEDPNYIDAYLGLGMYEYWRSVFTKKIRFLPFFSDHRQAGIEQVEMVVAKGKFANEMAEANLAFIFSSEKDFARSREIVDRYLKKYPKNVILRQLSGDIFINLKKFDKAAVEYKKIYEIDPALTKALYRLGRIYFQAGKVGIAKNYFERFLATAPEKDWRESTEKQLQQILQ